jgi:hypothetical protein
MKYFILVLLIMLPSLAANSQVGNSSNIDSVYRSHSPSRAVLYSALVPGLGQLYNKKYWKLPFIYGAGGALAYGFTFNQLKYAKFSDAVFTNEKSHANVLIDGRYYDYQQQLNGQNYYRRNRDLCVLGLGAVYLLNIIDAMVDAHFYYFDVSDDLSIRLVPSWINNPGLTASFCLGINFGF